MARHFTVTLTSGTNIGPYTIYHTSSTNGNQALLYGTTNQATGLTLAQVQGGVLITVPDNANSVIFYNTNGLLIKNCPTNIVEYPLTPSGTPVATPPPTYGSTPQPTPNATPVATPLPTDGSTPQPTPDATPVATPPPTYGETPQPTPDATPVATPNATPNATPLPTTELETYYRLQRCGDSQDYHVPKDVYCQNGNLSIMSDPGYSIDDVVQIRGADFSGCSGATYCATVISTTFESAPGTEDGYISRIPTVPDCDDFVHCTE